MLNIRRNSVVSFFVRHGVVVGIVLALLLFGVFVVRVILFSRGEELFFPSQKIHYYGNPSRSVEQIRIKAVYMAPSEQDIADGWYAALQSSLAHISRFHQLQFLGKSSIVFDIYPEPLVADIARGPKKTVLPKTALDTLRGVLKERINSSPDNFSGFIQSSPNEFVVTLFLVETEESYAQENSLVFSRRALTNEIYLRSGDALLYHAFAQTLGIPVSYDSERGTAISEDVMGYGKFRPLELNYIGTAVTRRMGLLE